MKRFLVLTITVAAVLSLGLVLIHCGGGGDKHECDRNEDCPTGYWCDRTVYECKPICVPQCDDKCCGDDGCGSTCPDKCPSGYECNTTTCECEQTGCVDANDCDDPDTQCCINGVCQDMDCGVYQCGEDDVCGYECGPCPEGYECSNHTCLEIVSCEDDTDCAATECCDLTSNKCVAEDCANRECGPDPVCGHSCGTCDAGEACNETTGVCEEVQVTGSCPPNQVCTDLTTDGSGYYGCVIPPMSPPPGNQTGCDPWEAGIYCDGNYTCIPADPTNVCIENCGDCPAGTVCSEILEGYMGCLTAEGDMPANAPVCGTGNPCVGNYSCWTFTYGDGTSRTGCIDNCNLGYGCDTEGETRCQGEVSQTCTSGTWVDTTDCSANSQVCNRDTGLCIPFPELGGFCENTGLQCAEGLDCIGTSESAHAFCTPQCDCTSYTGCDAGWECLFSSGGDPPTCWCARLCTTAADCPDGGAGGYSCEVLAQDGEGNDILGCMIL